MKVWVILGKNGGEINPESCLYGIFSNKKIADTFLRLYKSKRDVGEDYLIVECELDTLTDIGRVMLFPIY